jgi:Uma2 family endonuclease
MTVQDEQLMTVAEYEAFIRLPENADRRFELFQGEMIEMEPTFGHGKIAGTTVTALNNYLAEHPIGVAGVEIRIKAPDDDSSSVVPDVSFYRQERAESLDAEEAAALMPDLAIEIKSPSDSINRMRAKAAYYLEHDVALVWLVLPEHGLVEVYQPERDVTILKETDTLTGADVLPGFSIPVATLLAV